MTVRDLMLAKEESQEVVDVDEHFQLLGLERTHIKSSRRRVPASLREPLEPFVLDKVKRKAGWAAGPKMVAELLETVAAANAKVVPAGSLVGVRSDFECVSAPPMSITAYMRQLSILGQESAWPAALSILDRLGRYADMPFTPLTAHRLVLTAFSIASREMSDSDTTNHRVAKVAGVSLHDLQKMEGSLLKLLSAISSEVSWDALIGLHDAPLVKACLPKVVRAALRDHAVRSAFPVQTVTHILPSYLDCMSSAEPSPTSSCSSCVSPLFSITSKRILEAKQFALSQPYGLSDCEE